MCPDRELLSAWFDGEVPSPWNETIERHVAGCPVCSESVARMQGIHKAFVDEVAAMEPDATEARTRVMERLSSAVPVYRNNVFWGRRVSMPLPVAAAAAVAIVALAFALAGSGRRNAELEVAVRKAIEATSVATSGIGMESVIDFISRQDSAININITLPPEAFLGAGEPFIVREADYKPGSRQ